MTSNEMALMANIAVEMQEDRLNDVLDKIKAEIIKYECDCRLSDDEYPSCKQCTDSVFGSIYEILDKHKAEARDKE